MYNKDVRAFTKKQEQKLTSCLGAIVEFYYEHYNKIWEQLLV